MLFLPVHHPRIKLYANIIELAPDNSQPQKSVMQSNYYHCTEFSLGSVSIAAPSHWDLPHAKPFCNIHFASASTKLGLRPFFCWFPFLETNVSWDLFPLNCKMILFWLSMMFCFFLSSCFFCFFFFYFFYFFYFFFFFFLALLLVDFVAVLLPSLLFFFLSLLILLLFLFLMFDLSLSLL